MTFYSAFMVLAAIALVVVLIKAFFTKGEEPEQPEPENNWEVKDRSKYQKGSGGYEADAGGV
ncbi:hypothetical protein [Parasphingorhabdus sp.]|uniref:hypothetical protein n=1 Tax=Parasphingorhabdus sp. TaxID=2709688 RepID=UPI0035940839